MGIKDYNVRIDGKRFFDQSVKNDKIIYEIIRKNPTGLGDDYTSGYLLDYPYVKDNYQIIVKDWIKASSWCQS